MGIHEGKLAVVTAETLYVWKYDESIWDEGEETADLPLLVVSLAAYGAKIDSAYLTIFRPEWTLPSHPDSSLLGMTIVMRRKAVSPWNDEIVPYVVYWTSSSTSSLEEVNYTQFEPQLVSPHYCADLRIAPSGRGLLVVQARGDDNKIVERLESFDFIPRDPRTGLANSPTPRLTCRPVSLLDAPNGIVTCTSMDYDDVEGRVVVASSEGKISLFEFA